MKVCPVCRRKFAPPVWALRGSRTGKFASVHLCLSCGFLFQRPSYHEDDAALAEDFQWHLDKADAHLVQSNRILATFEEMRPEGKTLLDIGCGVGASLLAAKKLGIRARGVEPNHRAAEYARTVYGLDVIEGYFEKDLLPQKFDYVILDMVLEHVPDPPTLIEATLDALKPGGVLYLAVPTRTKAPARILFSLLFPRARRSLFLDNDVHINHFSRSNIQRLISVRGARIERDVAGGVYYIRASA